MTVAQSFSSALTSLGRAKALDYIYIYDMICLKLMALAYSLQLMAYISKTDREAILRK